MHKIAVKDLLLSRACDQEQVDRLLAVLACCERHEESGGHANEIIDVMKVYMSINAVEDVRNPIVLSRDGEEYAVLRGSCRIATAIAKGLTHLPAVIDGEDSKEEVLRCRQV